MRQIDLHTLPSEPLSHDAGSSKQVFIRNGSIPHLTQFAQARIPSGTSLTPHAHADMHEVFLVLSGSGEVRGAAQTLPLLPGTCIHIPPAEIHSFHAHTGEDLLLLYFGVCD